MWEIIGGVVLIIVGLSILNGINESKKNKAIQRQLSAEYDGWCAIYELFGYACLVDVKTMQASGTNFETELVTINDIFTEFNKKGYIHTNNLTTIRNYFGNKIREEEFKTQDHFKKIDELIEVIKKMNPGDPKGNLAELDSDGLNQLVLVGLVRVIAADLVFDEDEKRYYDLTAEKLGVSDASKKAILDVAKGGTKAAIRTITLRSLAKIPTVTEKMINFIDEEFEDLSKISSITADEFREKVPGLNKAAANAILNKFVKHKEREKKV